MDLRHGVRSTSSLPRSGGHALPAFQQAEVLDSDEYFRVVIRVRPPLDRELASPVWQHVVSVPGSTQICLYETVPEMNAADRASGTRNTVVNTRSFSFDHVYDQNASQPTVYESTARTSVMSALEGYNATIVAYGPTSTGKTYTMEGGLKAMMEDSRGIIPRSMEEIFEHIRGARNEAATFQVRASYLQIYNEVISDLLKPDRSHLMIREDKRRGVFVEGLSEWLCRSADEVQTLMEHGSTARATAQTGHNDTSSRSHAVFIIVVERHSGSPEGRQSLTGRLNLVDLAGSERPRLTGATGQRLEETKKINQSLSALGNVISALTERRARSHVPYRDSKLTRLLEDSLGGNCRTTMMAMVSPAAEAFAESLSTLKFAQRAKGVVVTPQVNEDVDPRMMANRYEAEIRRLRSELAEQASARNGARTPDAGPKIDGEALYSRSLSDFSGGRAGSSKILVEEAPAGRYKQLLLKQRDIMITLTQRLHERDETIISLQAELDSRDQRERELQERLERQAVRLAAAEKALQASSKANMVNMSGGSWSSSPARRNEEAELKHLPRYLPESRVDVPNDQRGFGMSSPSSEVGVARYGQRLLSADDKVLELTSLLETQRQENHRIRLELEALQPPAASLAAAMACSFSRDVRDPASWADAEVRSLRAGRSQGAATPTRPFR